MDGARIFELLVDARRRLSARDGASANGGEASSGAAPLVEEAGLGLAGLRRLLDLQELLLEVTALVAGEVEASEIDAKLSRAISMEEELAAELGEGTTEGPASEEAPCTRQGEGSGPGLASEQDADAASVADTDPRLRGIAASDSSP